MSNALLSFLFAAGASTWLYSKMMRQTGNNAQTSILVSGGAGLILFMLFWTVLAMAT